MEVRDQLHNIIDSLPEDSLEHITYILNSVKNSYVEPDELDRRLIDESLSDNEKPSDMETVAKRLGIDVNEL